MVRAGNGRLHMRIWLYRRLSWVLEGLEMGGCTGTGGVGGVNHE